MLNSTFIIFVKICSRHISTDKIVYRIGSKFDSSKIAFFYINQSFWLLNYRISKDFRNIQIYYLLRRKCSLVICIGWYEIILGFTVWIVFQKDE